MPERLMLGIAYEPYKFKCRDKKKLGWLSDVLDKLYKLYQQVPEANKQTHVAHSQMSKKGPIQTFR